MELLAENRFAITKALFIEGRLALSRDNFKKTAWKLGAMLLLLVLALAVGSQLLGMGIAVVGMELLVLALMAFWLFYRMPRSSAGAAYKALTRKWGEEPERVTRFYADRLEIEGPGVDIALRYGQIRQVLRTKRLLILVSEEDSGVLLLLDGFTLGGEAEVRRLVEAASGGA